MACLGVHLRGDQMYTYEPIRCTPAEERLLYNRPDLWGRGVPSGRGRAGARPSRVAVRVPPAGRVGVFAITSFVNRGWQVQYLQSVSAVN